MAPFPSEIDVFGVPHTRMKQLVSLYIEQSLATDFRNNIEFKLFLDNLLGTLTEFKSHEQIENEYIMRKLQKRLIELSIHNPDVCNCHNDNRLIEIIDLVHKGQMKRQWTKAELHKYSKTLKTALDEFTGVFLPHMKEEEEVFQPLLMKYFGYDELKHLKEVVIQEHCNRSRSFSDNVEEFSEHQTTNQEEAIAAEAKALKQQVKSQDDVHGGELVELAEGSSHQDSQDVTDSPKIDSTLLKLDAVKNVDETCNLVTKFYNCCSKNKKITTCCSNLNKEPSVALEDATMRQDEEKASKEQQEREVEEVIKKQYQVDNTVCSESSDINSGAVNKEVVYCHCQKVVQPFEVEHIEFIPFIFSEESEKQSNYFSMLPNEIMLYIFKHLSLRTLARCAQVNNHFHEILSDDSLWSEFNPKELCRGLGYTTNDFHGDAFAALKSLSFFAQTSDSVALRNSLIDGFDDDDDDNSYEPIDKDKTLIPVEKETALYRSVKAYLLPHIGANITKFTYNHSTILTATEIQKMLSCSPNVKYLDLSFTNAGNFSFKNVDLTKLEYLDLTSCYYLTNMGAENLISSLLNISKDKSDSPPHRLCPKCSLEMIPETTSEKIKHCNLQFLSLNGCSYLTDFALICLANSGVLLKVHELNLSGCGHFTGVTLRHTVERMPSLCPEKLSYCNRIIDGPYQKLADGCQNVDSVQCICCQTSVKTFHEYIRSKLADKMKKSP